MKAELLCLPAGFFAGESRSHLKEIVLRLDEVVKKSGIRVAVGVELPVSVFQNKTREGNTFQSALCHQCRSNDTSIGLL